jgi:hypothetical protein
MGFFFWLSTQVKDEMQGTDAFTWVQMQKKKPVISNTDRFFCFNSIVSNLYNNDVLIYKITQSRENSFVCERVYLRFITSFSYYNLGQILKLSVTSEWLRQYIVQ